MEVPVINRLTEFETAITSLPNPSFLSQILAFSGIERIYHPFNLWKWGTLILALLASWTTIVNSLKALIIKFKDHYSPTPSLHSQFDFDSGSDSDSDDDSVSSSEEAEEDEIEDLDERESSAHRSRSNHFTTRDSSYFYYKDENQGRDGNFALRKRLVNNRSFGDMFSWSEITSGKNVVKLWDNLSSGLDYLNNFNNSRNMNELHLEYDVVSFYDKRNNDAFSTSSISPAMVVAAGRKNVGGNLLMRVWDTRLGCRIPAILAEWRPKLLRSIARVANGGRFDKVFVGDGVATVVGDLRNVASPLVELTEADVDSWWDANRVSDDDNGESSY